MTGAEAALGISSCASTILMSAFLSLCFWTESLAWLPAVFACTALGLVLANVADKVARGIR